MYQIVTKEELTPVTDLFEVLNPAVARKAKAGQFVVIRLNEKGERVPLTIADFDQERGTITLVVQKVGKTTMQMGRLGPGDRLANLVGPLGNPVEMKDYGSVICVGGGSGIAAIYPLARALKDVGNAVHCIIGARTKALIFWDRKIRSVCDNLIICTDDGSCGRKALVSVPLNEMLATQRSVDHVFAIGPAIMMKVCSRCARPLGVPTTASLNAVMIDGTGMCGGCRVEVGGQMRFACVDGPKFDGHQVNWDLLLARQSYLRDEEQRALQLWEHACRLEQAEANGLSR